MEQDFDENLLLVPTKKNKSKKLTKSTHAISKEE